MSGKIIIVTGASRGIGLAVSQLLLQPLQGCRVVVMARNQEALERLSSQDPGRVIAVPGDFTDLSLGEKAVKLAVSKWGSLDGLVINHGTVDPVERVIDADLDTWKKSFDVNFFSAVALIKAALPQLRRSKGRIIMTSSGAATRGSSAWGCYGASKALINHLALTMAKEELEVTTMAIRPGVVDTDMQAYLLDKDYKNMDQADADRYRGLKKEGKMLKPQQPGNVIARLVLNAPLEMSGQFVNWDDASLSAFQDL